MCLYIDRSVQSYNRMYYTWENPAGPRKLVWEDNNGKEIEDDLRKVNVEDDGKMMKRAKGIVRKSKAYGQTPSSFFSRIILVPSNYRM